MSWMDVIKPLQKALYKAPEQFDEVHALVSDALVAAKETAKQELDSMQLGVDLGETLSQGQAFDEREYYRKALEECAGRDCSCRDDRTGENGRCARCVAELALRHVGEK